MLEINSVSYRVTKRTLLDSISVEFKPGSFSMIIGPNGSGKSTLLKTISGDLKPDTGYIKYENAILNNNNLKKIAKIRATMSQHSILSFPMTVEEVVLMGRYPHFESRPTSMDIDISRAALNKLSIDHLRDRNYLTLSGGERQRVHFAKSLAQVWEQKDDTIKYLLLDEPIASLDPNYQHEFLSIAKEFASKNRVVVAVMHDINLASQYGDYFVALKDGILLKKGTCNEIMNAPLLSELYGIAFMEIKSDVTSFPIFFTQKQ